MSANDHISDADLLLASEGELADDALARIQAHLTGCATCALKLDDLKQFDVLLSDAGALIALRHRIGPGQQKPGWRETLHTRWAVVAVACVLIMALLIVPPGGELSARECIVRAVALEERQASRHHRLRLSTDARRWIVSSDSQVASSDPYVERWRTAFADAGLDWNAPANAKRYQLWSDGLPAKKQGVEHTAGEMYVITEATEGPVRRGELELDPHTYAVTGATWDFAALGTIHVSVETEPPLPPPQRAAIAPMHTSQPRSEAATPMPAPDLELTELQVRRLLYDLHADMGEPIEVRRDGDIVRVEGVTDSEEQRAALLEALRSVPHVDVAVRSSSDLAADLPAATGQPVSFDSGHTALAQEWMEKRYANPADARAFALATLELAGQAQAHDHALRVLGERYRLREQLSEESARILLEIRSGHEQELARAWCALAGQLRGLLHPDSEASAQCAAPGELNNGQRAAMELVGPLVSRGNAPLSLEDALEQLRAVFP